MRTLIFALTLLMFGCVNTQTKQVDRLLILDKAHYKNTITLVDDQLETRAEINTQMGFQEKRGLVGIVWDDNFLRAYIDKETGLTTYQVYDVIYYKDGWAYFNVVNYSTPDGTKTKDLISISKDVESCSSNQFIGCTFREDAIWYLDRDLLDAIAKGYEDPAKRSLAWKYKIKAKNGFEQIRFFMPAEVAALLEHVDSYKAKHNLP